MKKNQPVSICSAPTPGNCQDKMTHLAHSQRRLILQAMVGFAVGMKSMRSFAAPPINSSQEKTVGIHTVIGDVYHNGRPSILGTKIRSGDILESGAGAEAVFIIGRSAFLLRERSRIEISSTQSWIRGFLRLVNGGLLSVFGHGDQRIIHTSNATIGIRGTGLYLETNHAHTYLCTCYGTVDITLTGTKSLRRETVQAQHHNGRLIQNTDLQQPEITPAIMLGHQDSELVLLESLVGRRPPNF